MNPIKWLMVPILGLMTISSTHADVTIGPVPPTSILSDFGVQPGDVIVAVNGQPIADQRMLQQTLKFQTQQGQSIRLSLRNPTTGAIWHLNRPGTMSSISAYARGLNDAPFGPLGRQSWLPNSFAARELR